MSGMLYNRGMSRPTSPSGPDHSGDPHDNDVALDEDELKPWRPEATLKSLETEIQVLDDGDARRAADRIFKDAVPGAARSIVHAAMYCTNEQVRLKAAQTVVDRVLGPVGSQPPNADEFREFLDSVMGVNADGSVEFEITD
jgi:hypothetical protein